MVASAASPAFARTALVRRAAAVRRPSLQAVLAAVQLAAEVLKFLVKPPLARMRGASFR